MADDDDEGEGGFGGLYENGHWQWDDNMDGLVYVSDIVRSSIDSGQIQSKLPTGTIEFRDDVDLLEQIRFRRRYQRKLAPGQADVITVQDVKDIALFTAPMSILSPMLINMLHLSTTERFIRALVLYCQYYLQIADEMSNRMLEQETKVRTPSSDVVEMKFRDNLSDLRILVAKEYGIMLIGGADTKHFHHMGALKKRRSLSDKDARLYEQLLRVCVQIVWVAVGRKSFNQIELEINRIMKSEIFNSVEHNLRTGYISNMCAEEKTVLLGRCLRHHDGKLKLKSPLMNEVFCSKRFDYRAFGLGTIKYPYLPSRLRYMMHAVVGPEEDLQKCGVTVGILGLPRSNFDTMLRPIINTSPDYSASLTKAKASQTARGSKASDGSGASVKKESIYPDIILPEEDLSQKDKFPPHFPDQTEPMQHCNETQRLRWQCRYGKLLNSTARRS